MLPPLNPNSRMKLLISSSNCKMMRSGSEKKPCPRIMENIEMSKILCEPVDHNRICGGLEVNAFFSTLLKPLRRTHLSTRACEACHQWRLPSLRLLMVSGVVLLVFLRMSAWRPLGYQTFCTRSPPFCNVDVVLSSISATSKNLVSETTEHAKDAIVKDREQHFTNTRAPESNTFPQSAYDRRRTESDTRVPNLRTRIDGIIGWAWLAD